MTFNQLCVGIGTLMLVFLGKKLGDVARRILASHVQSTKNEQIKLVVSTIEKTVTEVVDYLRVNIVAEIKEKSEDGKLTNDEIVQIKQMAGNHIMDTLSDNALLLLEELVDDVDRWLDIKIEKAVIDTKK